MQKPASRKVMNGGLMPTTTRMNDRQNKKVRSLKETKEGEFDACLLTHERSVGTLGGAVVHKNLTKKRET